MKQVILFWIIVLFVSCAKQNNITIDQAVNEEIALDVIQEIDKEIYYIKNESTADIFYTLRCSSRFTDGQYWREFSWPPLAMVSVEEKYDVVREKLLPGMQNRLLLISKTGENRHEIDVKEIINLFVRNLYVYDSNNRMFVTSYDFWRYNPINPSLYFNRGMEIIEDEEYLTYTITITDEIIESWLSIYSTETILELISRDWIDRAVDYPIDGINIRKVSDFVIVGKTLAKYFGESEILIIPSGVEIMGSNAFHFMDSDARQQRGIRSIKEIILPDTVKIIGDSAFYDLINLEKINIPVTVTTIGSAAFKECYNLKEIVLSDSILEIGSSAFSYSGLENIIVPPKIKSINGSTFRGCRNLASVSLPNGLESIGESAFNDCEKLESINVPITVEFIDYNAFASCDKLTVDILPPAHRHKSYLFRYIKLDG